MEQVKEQTETTKMPPHDLDSEEWVLGSCLIDPEAIIKIPTLVPADFYREKNRWAFDAMKAIQARGESVNQITVAYELARQQKLEALGGAAYLSHVINQVPTSVHVVYYANMVRECSLRRRLIILANQIAGISYDMSLQPEALSQKLLSVQQKFNELLNTNSASMEPKRAAKGNRKTVQPIELKE